MYFRERHNKILDILEKRNSASVHYLAQALYVSEPTIRRDLAILQEQGKIRRTFGGAVLSDLINKEVPFALREHENRRAKDEIARMAAKHIRDGQIIFLDASSTASYLTPYLYDQCIKSRYSRRPEDAEMFDVLREGIVYDPGRVLANVEIFSFVRSSVAAQESVSSRYQRKLDIFTSALSDVNFAFS